MRTSKVLLLKRLRAVAFLSFAVFAFLSLAAPARAWTDPFMDWTAGGYLQVLQINRPTDGRPPTGILDSFDDGAGGYTWDGPQFRMLGVSLSGPLGFDGVSAVLATQVYLSTASLTDIYVRWDGAFGSLRLGQAYLPFGIELQTSFKDLITIQRSLIYGFENYGHTQAWGLQLMSQRGWGLRWDRSQGLGPLTWTAQVGLQDFQGAELYQNAPGGIGRLVLGWQRGSFQAQAAYSVLVARGQLLTPPANFVPLGAAQGAAFEPSADLAGHHVIEAWGPDAEASAGPLHGRCEVAEQSLDGLTRGGGEATLWLDLGPGLRALQVPASWQAARIYAKSEQASSNFGDGIHQAGALYRAQTYGLGLPTGLDWANLRLEYLDVASDSFGGSLPDGRIYQVQLQFQL